MSFHFIEMNFRRLRGEERSERRGGGLGVILVLENTKIRSTDKERRQIEVTVFEETFYL
jgi:hypothetical protein